MACWESGSPEEATRPMKIDDTIPGRVQSAGLGGLTAEGLVVLLSVVGGIRRRLGGPGADHVAGPVDGAGNG